MSTRAETGSALGVPWCCYIDPVAGECPAGADWTLILGPRPDDNTQSCEAHVGRLLGDDPLVGIERVTL